MGHGQKVDWSGTIEERLYGRCEISPADAPAVSDYSACWIFRHAQTGGDNRSKRYGSLWYDGRQQLAHRVSYQVSRGVKLPLGNKDLQVDHICRNRRCVNPTHLRLVTAKQNTAYMLENKIVPYHCPGCRCGEVS